MSIKLYDIKNEKFIEENVPAESFMRFLYSNPFGKLSVWALFKRAFFSRWCGVWADSSFSAKTISKFIVANKINIDEMLLPPESFKSFNAFFTRALKDSARPVEDAQNSEAISFPSDGRHLLIKDVSNADTFYTKGQKFNLEKFLGDKKLAEYFEGGDMLISRLAPVDYHRFHFPFDCVISARRKIEGALFSVSPIALVPRISVFWENRRVLNVLESARFGMCAFVEIGATNVGSIVNSREVGDTVSRGDEAGYFNFGGSCVVTLFPKSANIKWNEKLVEMSAQSVECYSHVNAKSGVGGATL